MGKGKQRPENHIMQIQESFATYKEALLKRNPAKNDPIWGQIVEDLSGLK